MPQREDMTLALDLQGLQVPHLEQYFGVWGVEELRFRALVSRFDGFNVGEHVLRMQQPAGQAELVARRQSNYSLAQGVAVIDVAGVMLKYVSSLEDGTSTVAVRQQVRKAVADPAVTAILLRIDSPGGVIAGTKDLADDVAAAAARKPTWAYVDDNTASAAYWVASQAKKIYANEMGHIGSIGVFAVLEDLSKMAESLGVKVHVVRTGPFKGAGIPGTEITDEHLAEVQRIVDGIHEHFLAAVATGRKLSIDRVRELADGRVHQAADARKLKLIDGVQSFDETLRQLAELGQQKANGRTRAMTTPTETAAEAQTETQSQPTKPAVTAATLAELKAACPGAEPAFIVGQLEKAATVAQATSAFIAHQQAELAKREEELKTAKAATASGAGNSGVDGLADGDRAGKGTTAESGDALADFRAAVDGKMKAGMKREAAVRAVVSEQPELQERVVAAANAGRTRRK